MKITRARYYPAYQPSWTIPNDAAFVDTDRWRLSTVAYRWPSSVKHRRKFRKINRKWPLHPPLVQLWMSCQSTRVTGHCLSASHGCQSGHHQNATLTRVFGILMLKYLDDESYICISSGYNLTITFHMMK